MTFFAGVLRTDGQAISSEWIDGLRQTSGESLSVLAFGEDTIFLASEGSARAPRPGEILLCDARFDVREAEPPQPAEEDADYLARGWRGGGDAWLCRQHGDYAAARWDTDARQLRLVRSALGTRPLFYTSHDGVFAFATAQRALLALPFVSRALDEGTICRVLCSDGDGAPAETFYADVQRLAGAHELTWDGRGIAVAPLALPWSTEKHRRTPAFATPESRDDAARRLLIDAVESRLGGGQTIAVHLSGGLDSSAIACIAARRLAREGRRLIALCSVLPSANAGPETDERAYIDAVLAQEPNIDPAWVELPVTDDPFAALPRWLECLGEPTYSNVTHAEEQLGLAGRARGVDVVLNGFGGDFFFSAAAPPLPPAMVAAFRWGAALTELKRLHTETGLPWHTLVAGQLLRPLLGRLRRRVAPPRGDASSFANPALMERIAAREGRRPTSSVPRNADIGPRATMHFLLAPGHVERVLPAMHQVFAEQFGQDLRFPMLDTRLIALVLSLSDDELYRAGRARALMRAATRGILPEFVRTRPDKGPAFDPALARRCVAARETLRTWAASAPPQCWDYVDRAQFLDALAAVEPSARDGWRRDMFGALLTGGRIAKFVEWHARAGAAR